MMKRIVLWLSMLLVPFAAKAQYAPFQGFCQNGGVKAVTSGLTSTNTLQGSYPKCLVTVYLTGTSTLASIYSNSTGTTLSNPFTATTSGAWIFYAGVSVDVTMSGGTPIPFPSPVTLTDLPAGGGAVGTCEAGGAAAGSDIGAAVQACYNSATTPGVNIHIQPGNYTWTSNVAFSQNTPYIKTAYLDCDNGAVIHYTPTSGSMLNWNWGWFGSNPNQFNNKTLQNGIGGRNCQFYGPDTTVGDGGLNAGTSVGFEMGSANGGVNGLVFDNMKLFGFYKGVDESNVESSFLWTFNQTNFSGNYYGIYLTQGIENPTINGGNFSANTHDILLNAPTGSIDLSILNVSFDGTYGGACSIQLVNNNIYAFKPHFENASLVWPECAVVNSGGSYHQIGGILAEDAATGAIGTVTLGSGGSGFTSADVNSTWLQIQQSGSTDTAQVLVTGVSAGAVTSVAFANLGYTGNSGGGYTVASGLSTIASAGAGTGATVNITGLLSNPGLFQVGGNDGSGDYSTSEFKAGAAFYSAANVTSYAVLSSGTNIANPIVRFDGATHTGMPFVPTAFQNYDLYSNVYADKNLMNLDLHFGPSASVYLGSTNNLFAGNYIYLTANLQTNNYSRMGVAADYMYCANDSTAPAYGCFFNMTDGSNVEHGMGYISYDGWHFQNAATFPTSPVDVARIDQLGNYRVGAYPGTVVIPYTMSVPVAGLGANTFTAVQTINLNAAAAPTPPTGYGLQISGVDGSSINEQLVGYGSGASYITLQRSLGTNASPTAMSGILGQYIAGGYDGAGWYNSGQIRFATATSPWTTSDHSTYAQIYTVPVGSTSATAMARFQPSGGLSVGTASFNATDPGQGIISSQNGYTGAATAPSGSCSPNGVWVFSQDGHATVCLSGTWSSKI